MSGAGDGDSVVGLQRIDGAQEKIDFLVKGNGEGIFLVGRGPGRLGGLERRALDGPRGDAGGGPGEVQSLPDAAVDGRDREIVGRREAPAVVFEDADAEAEVVRLLALGEGAVFRLQPLASPVDDARIGVVDARGLGGVERAAGQGFHLSEVRAPSPRPGAAGARRRSRRS